MADARFLAFDLGAESGRAVVGTLAEGRLTLEEIHRFANEPVEIAGTLHWDILGLYNQVLKGMRLYAERFGPEVASLGIDSWSVDFGLLAADGSLLANPVHYRDRRTEGMVEVAAERMPLERMYELTGMSPNQIHTAFQMLALREQGSPVLPAAATFLMIPDLLAYFLTGARLCERSNAIHSQLYDPRRGEWCGEVFAALGLPLQIMPPLVDPGTQVGTLRESVQRATGLGAALVVAPCTHDTGSAVAAVPFRAASRALCWGTPAGAGGAGKPLPLPPPLAGEGVAERTYPAGGTPGPPEDAAFLSSGTWSVLGALTPEPVTTPEAYAARINNELSLDFFVCRNIMGLWLLQECRRAWEREGASYTYGELVEMAQAAPAGGPVVFPDAPDFLAPPDMPAAIREYCRTSGQAPPEGTGPTVRCILESLALSYRQGLEQFSQVLGHGFEVVHVVGGGSQNALLCQLTADATGLPVTAGPVEATVAGNLLVQALAAGVLADVEELREVVRASFQPQEYGPEENGALEEQWGRYGELAD